MEQSPGDEPNDGGRQRRSGRPSWLVILVLAVVATLAGVMTARFVTSPHKSGYEGFGGDFTLQSADGPVSLSDFRGKVVAMYFGYTYCPDVCPTTLATLAGAYKRLGEGEREAVQMVLVTVDPERDDAEKLKEYTRFFDPSMIGLTGTREQIDEVTRKYGVVAVKAPLQGPELGYTVDHSARVYIIGRDGVVLDLVAHGATVDDFVLVLRRALEG